MAPSLASFLEHWLAAGCFSSHNFLAWFPRVEHLVPVKVPRRQNLWLQHHDRQFGTRFALFEGLVPLREVRAAG